MSFNVKVSVIIRKNAQGDAYIYNNVAVINIFVYILLCDIQAI